MLFKITSTDQAHNTVIQYYDNITQQVFDDNHRQLSFDNDKYKLLKVDKLIPSNYELVSFTNQLDHLKIQFGLQCNFHCRYCNQRHDRDFEKNAKIGDYTQAVDNLISKLKKANISCKYITLWGGEPLVYFKLLQVLIPALKKHFGDQCFINTISNGSLLTDEVVDFLTKYDIGFTISHDGPSFNVYRDDHNPLDDDRIVKCIQRLYDYYQEHHDDGRDFNPSLSINVVVTPENCNLSQLHSYFTNKIDRDVKFHFEGIVKCDRDSVNIISKFDASTAKMLQKNVFAAGISNPNGPYWSIRKMVSDFMVSIVNGDNTNRYGYSCDANSFGSMSIDLHGNILACHGSSPSLNTLGSIDQNLNLIKNTKITNFHDRKNCDKCPLVMMCKGGCPLVENDDHEIACTNLKLWHSAMFVAAWYNLFSLDVKRIEPCQ